MFNGAARATRVLMLGIWLTESATAKERRVEKAEVPPAVVAAVSAKYAKGKLTGFTKDEAHGTTVFEVRVELGTERREVEVAPGGKILGEERALSFQETPGAVQRAFAHSRFAKGEVLRAEESTRYVPATKVTYELLVKVGERTLELAYDPK